MGKRIECRKLFQLHDWEVRDVSCFTTGIYEKIWFSNKYNSFTPSGDHDYDVCVLFPQHVSVMTAKQGIARVLEDYYSRRGRRLKLLRKKYTR